MRLPTGGMAFGIALGSNLGDRESHLVRGVELLLQRLPEAVLLAGASLYETDPVDCAPDAQPFLNSVIEVGVRLAARELYAHLAAVEQALGRPSQRARNAPRTLDLDVLYAGDQVSQDPDLILPHPRLHERRFVLQPLAEIRPELILPGQPGPVADLLAALDDDPASVRRAGSWRFHRRPG